MLYFVHYFGDMGKDPLNEGVFGPVILSEAVGFITTIENKGFHTHLYEGKIIKKEEYEQVKA